MQITFKKFSLEDVPLYYKWAEKSHVKEIWFQEGFQSKEYILEKIAGNGIEYPFVILINDKPIGHIQFWDIYARDRIEKMSKIILPANQKGHTVSIYLSEKKTTWEKDMEPKSLLNL